MYLAGGKADLEAVIFVAFVFSSINFCTRCFVASKAISYAKSYTTTLFRLDNPVFLLLCDNIFIPYHAIKHYAHIPSALSL